jgi:hypothetical protein
MISIPMILPTHRAFQLVETTKKKTAVVMGAREVIALKVEPT